MIKPVTRREMVELIEWHIHNIYTVLAKTTHTEPELLRQLQVYTAISLKLRMEENPNAQD